MSPIDTTTKPQIPVRVLGIAGVVGAVGVVAMLIGFFVDHYHFYRAYLFGWLVILAVPLGAMGYLMIQHLTGGAWGFLTRRIAEAAMGTLPLVAILGIPLIFGAHDIFPWASEHHVAAEPMLRHRAPHFQPAGVLLRSAIFVGGWVAIALLLRMLSGRHDKTGSPSALSAMRKLSTFGLIFYFVSMSLASFDWIASREVDWYSSTFGLTTCVGQAATGLCVMSITLAMLRNVSPLKEIITEDRVHDLGNLLLANTVLWSYVSFAQYLVIWIGNSQEDIVYFIHRVKNPGWGIVGTVIIIFHFGVPFLLLLFQKTKRRPESLAIVALLVLAMRVLDNLWMVAPSNADLAKAQPMSWIDPFGVIGLGGIWAVAFLWMLGRRSLVPRAYVDEVVALEHESHGREHGTIEPSVG